MYTLILNAQEHPHDLTTVLGNSLIIFLSFTILLYIINKFAAGPILSMMEKREEHIAKQLDDGQMALENAQLKEQEAASIVRNAQIQANDILVSAKDASEKHREMMVTQIQEELQQMKEVARASIEQERAEMLIQLQKQVGEMSVALAQKIIQREVNQADHQHLIDNFIEGLDK
ncbi:F0F1 ATP synthase subunit B [Carnobacteriaceae bacterium zg-ZUI252]|nr:F0F1 ATP synthase subunit B [Carnobacteriaceae bacterium zg-ZUI252]MBS4769985.1 F0F1 ATP synthase subunit B [Carnobacteriaceae bacterium zg-ZUI240]QTU83206.1 F0F1 ATP synthase subunit B [Carnobacteriaceae bacterium zg-C25]